MRHLYHTRAEVLRLEQTISVGVSKFDWVKIDTVVDPLLGVPGELMCRIDLNFMRPGKDQPMPLVAGRAPDRIGLMFFDDTDGIFSGDRIRTLAGPVRGTFEIRANPDPAITFSAVHHMEVQVIEVSQGLRNVTTRTEP